MSRPKNESACPECAARERRAREQADLFIWYFGGAMVGGFVSNHPMGVLVGCVAGVATGWLVKKGAL